MSEFAQRERPVALDQPMRRGAVRLDPRLVLGELTSGHGLSGRG